jgi:hypothetical protein
MVASPFAKTKSVGFASLECRPYGTGTSVEATVWVRIDGEVGRHMVFVIGGSSDSSSKWGLHDGLPRKALPTVLQNTGR